MVVMFYISAIVAVVSTVMVITRYNAVHALLYLVVSLLSAASIFFLLGAPFVAVLEIIIYAGAIMVLFIFVIMMLNIGIEEELENKWLKPKMWIIPSFMALVLLVDFIYVVSSLQIETGQGTIIGPGEVGASLFTTYLLAVEIAAVLLAAGIVGAYHLGKRKKIISHRYLNKDMDS